MRRIVWLGLTAVCVAGAQPYTRGIGVYPGDPREDFGPALVIDGTTYRNLALHRPAYHSSSYDYNLTAQLITDGIKETALPRWLVAATSEGGVLAKTAASSSWTISTPPPSTLRGAKAWVQFGLEGGDGALEVDRIAVVAHVQVRPAATRGLDLHRVGIRRPPNLEGTRPRLPGRTVRARTSLRRSRSPAPSRSRFYRVDFEAASVSTWQMAEVTLFDRNRPCEAGRTVPLHQRVDERVDAAASGCTSIWARPAPSTASLSTGSAGPPTEPSRFRTMPRTWRTLRGCRRPAGPTTTEAGAARARARYVRVLMTKAASPEGYILSEMEVYGRGGPVAKPKARAGGACRWPPGPRRRRLALAARFAGQSRGRGASRKTGFPGQGLDHRHRSGHGADQLPERRARVPDPNFGDNQLHDFGFLLLCRFLVSR